MVLVDYSIKDTYTQVRTKDRTVTGTLLKLSVWQNSELFFFFFSRN